MRLGSTVKPVTREPAELPMPFLTVGISHATAPVAIRERLSFGAGQIPAALRAMTALSGVEEAALLSTCNRTEVYAHVAQGSGKDIADWLASVRGAEDPSVRERLYIYSGEDSARHLFRVACGLDSMILGEPQILGQIKEAYELAQRSGVTGNYLNRLFQFTFAVAKQVRTDTHIGDNPVSVAYASVRLARQIFSEFTRLTPLLIGAGETIELVARHLREQGTHGMIIANRSLEHAHALAEQFGGYAIGLHEIPAHLREADIAISSTASPGIVLDRAMVATALKTRKHRPLLMIDLAVPRDIDPEVAKLADVYLFTIDGLRDVVGHNLHAREQAAHQADLMIETQVAEFMQQLRGLDAVPAIRAVREHAADIRAQTMAQARQMLASGAAPEVVLKFLADTLTNRLLHAPTAYLHRAALEGRDHILDQATAMFGLDATDHDKKH
ncbi:MAG: glutamyl-tRNA reductase [Gammaproteobacteria bacterium]